MNFSNVLPLTIFFSNFALKRFRRRNDITRVHQRYFKKDWPKENTNVKAKEKLLELVYKNEVNFIEDGGWIQSENEKILAIYWELEQTKALSIFLDVSRKER